MKAAGLSGFAEGTVPGAPTYAWGRMSVRRSRECDREALQALYRESRRDTFTWLDSESMQLSDFERDTEGESIWVAERDSLVVGFVSIYEAGNFIHNLFVRPDWTGRGVGSELLTISVRYLERPVRLKCLARNRKALSFYQGHGWDKVGEGTSGDGNYYVLEKT